MNLTIVNYCPVLFICPLTKKLQWMVKFELVLTPLFIEKQIHRPEQEVNFPVFFESASVIFWMCLFFETKGLCAMKNN